MNAQVQTGNSELMGMSGATIIDTTSSKKKVMVKNQFRADQYSFDDLVGAVPGDN